MVPLSDLPRLSPDAEASAAMDELARRDVDQLPVLEGGELRGLLRRRELIRWLALRGQHATDFHTEIEQAAFEPNNLVPGIGVSPDKMLLARVFSYADAHRARMCVNYKVMDDAARERLVSNVVGHLKKGVSRPVVDRALQYWRNVDPGIGERIERGVRDR